VSAEPIPFFAGARTWAAHGADYLAAMDAALADGRALQGPAVAAFEAALAGRCGRRHAIAVGSGTDALAFALWALGVGPGDEVVVPAVSFIASASCVARVGATPVFADVDEHCLVDAAAAAARVTPRTRAILAVDLFGQLCDPEPLEALCAAHGIALVLDCAQAPGATVGERPWGATGAASCCSFDPTKPIAAPGSGGAVLCDDDETAARLRRLRWHGRGADGLHGELGFNSQLPTASAAVLAAKLQQHDGWTARRREIARAYDDALAGGPHARVPTAPDRDHVFHKFAVRTPDRDALRARLAAAGAEPLVHYPLPLPRQPIFGDAAGGPWPRAEAHCATALSLPIHAFLRDDEVERVCAVLRAA
jgi:dTDP-4-amino-4,6-dideoxygalactose transaminase